MQPENIKVKDLCQQVGCPCGTQFTAEFEQAFGIRSRKDVAKEFAERTGYQTAIAERVLRHAEAWPDKLVPMAYGPKFEALGAMFRGGTVKKLWREISEWAVANGFVFGSSFVARIEAAGTTTRELATKIAERQAADSFQRRKLAAEYLYYVEGLATNYRAYGDMRWPEKITKINYQLSLIEGLSKLPK